MRTPSQYQKQKSPLKHYLRKRVQVTLQKI
jgi:hypothetical protein